MKPSSPDAHTYRLLGYLALAHALSLFAMLVLCYNVHWEMRERLLRCWVGLTTLWFLWPIVLILHRGRSWKRCVVFLLVGTVVFLPSLAAYALREGPVVFELPIGVALEPISISQYCRAYWAGRTEAQKDIAAGIMAMEVSGFGAGFGPGNEILHDRYQIEVRPVAGCMVDAKIMGHAAGYNQVADREINRRVGRARVDAAIEEGHQIAVANTARRVQLSKDLAKRLTSLPPDAKISLEIAKTFLGGRDCELDQEKEEEFAQILHAFEAFLLARMPKNTPSFKLRVTALSQPIGRAHFEISSPDHPPQSIWMNLYNNLDTIVIPRWPEGSFAAYMEFIVR